MSKTNFARRALRESVHRTSCVLMFAALCIVCGKVGAGGLIAFVAIAETMVRATVLHTYLKSEKMDTP